MPSPYKSDLVDVDVVVRMDREKSWGIEDPNEEGKLIFLPKSQCERDGNTMTMPQWLAREKGLI